MSKQKSNENARKEMAARTWLSYYNRVLYEKGIITERERNKIEVKINNWKISLT